MVKHELAYQEEGAQSVIPVSYTHLDVYKRQIHVVEYLFKGRFNRMLQETASEINLWNCGYNGPLYKDGETIEEVFGISDRQIINRIRECDGGEDTPVSYTHLDVYKRQH